MSTPEREATDRELSRCYADIDRVTAERDAQITALKAGNEYAVRKCQELQQRLTAADERADVLEGRVSMLLRELQELINDDDGILVAAELSTGFVWHALQKHGKAIEAALKPVEGGGDEGCSACGSNAKDWNCNQCKPF